MRLLLLVLLLSLPALPAAAGQGVSFSHGAIVAPHFRGFPRGRSFLRGSPFAFRGHGFGRGFGRYGYGGLGWGGWGYFPDWDWDWGGDWAAWNGGDGGAATAPAYPPPPPPMRYAANPALSVETTPQGVTIIRGPGTHHVLP
jgi:hypothetical protein